MRYFYHGSNIPGITALQARSKLRHSDEKVVYLTDCLPYALFYIWDAEHNGYHGKYVTAWVKDGVACYEEQFSQQLRTFYHGVAGHLYCVQESPDIKPVDGRENLYYASADVEVTKVEQIPDVYEALMQYEAAGKAKILRFHDQSPQRQRELTDLIASAIARANFFENDPPQRDFMKKHFPAAWENRK